MKHGYNMIRFMHNLRKLLSKSGLIVSIAIKIRNQCNLIIGLHLAPDHFFESTGEAVFLKSLEGKINMFFDIGANKGEWSEQLLKINPKARGILFEPNPDCINTLHQKFFGLQNIEICIEAVSDKHGVAAFFAERGGGENSSLSPVATHGARAIEVSISTIDEIIQKRGIGHVDYIKIDAEGFDFHILKGAEYSLQKKMIDVIQFEYSKSWRQNGATLSFAFSYLKNLGYTTYCLKPAGLSAFDPDIYMEYYAYSNFVSLKNALP